MGVTQTADGQIVYLPDFLTDDWRMGAFGSGPAPIPTGLPSGLAPPLPIAPAQEVPAPANGGLPGPSPIPAVLPSFAPTAAPAIVPLATPAAAPAPIAAPSSAAPTPAPAKTKTGAAKQPAGPALPADLAQAQQENLAGVEEQKQAQGQLAQSQAAAANEQAAAFAARDRAVADQQAANAQAEKQRQTEIAARQKQFDDSVTAFSTTKIDDQRRWKNMSTGQKVLAGISVALSGIGMAFMGKGGQNPALDMITNAIKDDVAAQVRDREGAKELVGVRRSSLDDYIAQTKNARDAESLKIAEEYKRTADTIETIAARHKGTDIAAGAANLAGQMREKAAQIIGSTGQQAYERGVKQQELGLQRAQVGLGYANLKQSDRHFEASQKQALQFHNDEMDQQAAQLALAGRKLEAAELKKQQAELNDRGFLQPVGVQQNPDGSVQPKYEWLKQQDGTPYMAPDKAADGLHKVVSGTAQTIDALDNLRRLREENGGNLTKWTTNAKAKLLEYERALVGAHQASGINGFRGNVMEVMDKMISGGADPTAIAVSIMPLLDRARENAITDLNIKMKKEGNYTGKDLSFPDPLKQAAPKAGAEDADLDRVNRDPLRDLGPAEVFREAGIDPARVPRTDTAPTARRVLGEMGGLLPSQRRIIDTQGALARSGDPTAAARARAFLEGVTRSKEASDAAKEYAAQQLSYQGVR